MDPQRLGTPTAAYDLHFQEQSMQRKHDLMNRGFLTVEYLGKRERYGTGMALGRDVLCASWQA